MYVLTPILGKTLKKEKNYNSGEHINEQIRCFFLACMFFAIMLSLILYSLVEESVQQDFWWISDEESL
jgi:hypothetical protein